MSQQEETDVVTNIHTKDSSTPGTIDGEVCKGWGRMDTLTPNMWDRSDVQPVRQLGKRTNGRNRTTGAGGLKLGNT